jgi:hypothetical protein
MSLKYEPILNDTSESECIRVKKYLIEFLEELRRINKNKNKNTIDLVQEIKCKEQDPIKIEVKIIRPSTGQTPQLLPTPPTQQPRILTPYPPNEELPKPIITNTTANTSNLQKPIAKLPKSDALRHIPQKKLTIFEDITLKKIRNDYKPSVTYFESGHNKKYETRSLREDSIKNLKRSSRPIFTRLDADPILKQLLENHYRDKVNYNYNFQQEFDQHLRQNDPYYNHSKLKNVY